jgi:hypothetical protein
MIPAAFPTIAPAQTVGELFGPLATIAVLGVVVGLVILVALLVAEAASSSRRTGRQPVRRGRAARETKTVSPVRPAA